jgi:putative transposase
MPRTARIVLPRYPHHVVQRGHNRQVIFAERNDYERYLATLQEFKRKFGIKVYAYCLMTNHVHLLLSPDDQEGIGKLMKRLAGRQTRYHNTLERRGGTLWEGRYKSSLVETEAYLLACCRYIELNRVRARMVSTPESYPWSSCSHVLGSRRCSWVDPSPAFLSLGPDDAQRKAQYRDYLLSAIPEDEWAHIRESLQRGQLTGTERFAAEISAMVGRRVLRRGPGRPKKQREK